MTKKHASAKSAGDTLREHGFRVTPGRVALLEALRKSGKPLSIQAIMSKIGDAQDQGTLYRTLTDLSNAGIVKRVDLNTGTAHFEYTPDHPHHHHVVCTDCGDIEDVEGCPLPTVQKTKSFKSIYSHNLEFFGICRSCAA